MKKLRHNPETDAGRMAEPELEFKEFRGESTQRNWEVQRKEAALGAFMAWLEEQRSRFDELTEGLPL